MSAPHELDYDVYFNKEKISSFTLDLDLDLPFEVFEEVSKLFKTQDWFDYKTLFRFPEHLFLKASKSDFVIEDHFYKSKTGELRLVLVGCRDFG